MIFYCVFRYFWISRLFDFPTLQDGPRGRQERPKTAREAPKTAPRRLWRAPRQPKRRPRGPERAPRRPQEGPTRAAKNSKIQFPAPRRFQEAPKGPKRPQEASKRPQGGPQEAPKRPQEAPKRLPKRPQNCCPEVPERRTTRSQRTLKRPLRHNPGTVAEWAEGPRRLPEPIQRLPRRPARPPISSTKAQLAPKGPHR